MQLDWLFLRQRHTQKLHQYSQQSKETWLTVSKTNSFVPVVCLYSKQIFTFGKKIRGALGALLYTICFDLLFSSSFQILS